MRPRPYALPILAICSALLVASPAAADDTAASHEAAKHFQRAVSLYGEADYRAALVEFKRAYAASPHTSVLYNIGETQFQLQDYASALTTFERYLAESSATDAHRAEVESNVEILRARVGHLSVTTIPPGADITVDDQPAGRSPLDPPLLVSIGHRKIVATILGRPPVTKYVDVATDDNLSVTMQIPDGASPAAAPDPNLHPWNPAPEPAPAPSHAGSTWRAIGWTMTGVLAAGSITMGLLALKASDDLSTERNVYPASASTLNHDSNLTSTYSIIADSLALGALVVGSITLVSSISSSGEPQPNSGAARLSLSPASARLDVTF